VKYGDSKDRLQAGLHRAKVWGLILLVVGSIFGPVLWVGREGGGAEVLITNAITQAEVGMRSNVAAPVATQLTEGEVVRTFGSEDLSIEQKSAIGRCGSATALQQVSNPFNTIVGTLCAMVIGIQNVMYNLLFTSVGFLADASGMSVPGFMRNDSLAGFLANVVPVEFKATNLEGQIINQGGNQLATLVVEVHTIFLRAVNAIIIFIFIGLALLGVTQINVKTYEIKKLLPEIIFGFILANISLFGIRAGLELTARATQLILSINSDFPATAAEVSGAPTVSSSIQQSAVTGNSGDYKIANGSYDSDGTFKLKQPLETVAISSTEIEKQKIAGTPIYTPEFVIRYCAVNAGDAFCLAHSLATVSGSPVTALWDTNDEKAVKAMFGDEYTVQDGTLVKKDKTSSQGIGSTAVGAIRFTLGPIANFFIDQITNTYVAPVLVKVFIQGILNLFLLPIIIMLFLLAAMFSLRVIVIYLLAAVSPLGFFATSISAGGAKAGAKKYMTTLSNWLFQPLLSFFWLWMATQWIQVSMRVGVFQAFNTGRNYVFAFPTFQNLIVYAVVLFCIFRALKSPISQVGEIKAAGKVFEKIAKPADTMSKRAQDAAATPFKAARFGAGKVASGISNASVGAFNEKIKKPYAKFVSEKVDARNPLAKRAMNKEIKKNAVNLQKANPGMTPAQAMNQATASFDQAGWLKDRAKEINEKIMNAEPMAVVFSAFSGKLFDELNKKFDEASESRKKISESRFKSNVENLKLSKSLLADKTRSDVTASAFDDRAKDIAKKVVEGVKTEMLTEAGEKRATRGYSPAVQKLILKNAEKDAKDKAKEELKEVLADPGNSFTDGFDKNLIKNGGLGAVQSFVTTGDIGKPDSADDVERRRKASQSVAGAVKYVQANHGKYADQSDKEVNIDNAMAGIKDVLNQSADGSALLAAYTRAKNAPTKDAKKEHMKGVGIFLTGKKATYNMATGKYSAGGKVDDELGRILKLHDNSLLGKKED
jgi:hypothetical protein